jgi:hypothetical protein
MMVEDFDALVNMAYAEGMDDGIRGDNLNPFDPDSNEDQWRAYEQGFMSGVMADYDTRFGE